MLGRDELLVVLGIAALAEQMLDQVAAAKAHGRWISRMGTR